MAGGEGFFELPREGFGRGARFVAEVGADVEIVGWALGHFVGGGLGGRGPIGAAGDNGGGGGAATGEGGDESAAEKIDGLLAH